MVESAQVIVVCVCVFFSFEQLSSDQIVSKCVPDESEAIQVSCDNVCVCVHDNSLRW